MEQKRIHLRDYRPPDFEVDKLALDFDLGPEFCRVISTATYKARNSDQPLVLDGVGLELVSLKLNDRDLSPSEFVRTPETLRITKTPNEFTLTVETRLRPQDNTSLEGLYKSSGCFVTQCEAQGFRKITYFPDRPDVMTKYSVRIEADKAACPVLLSNGDRVSTRDLPGNRHEARWNDPHKKPSYLFALVAGDLGVIRDAFTTKSGRKVNLEIYAAHGKQSRCHHAMQALKNAMKWDEERFGREYDLNDYMIVAIDDFNAGAMENKGLNIFNSRLVLADTESATDDDFYNIEAVVGHEFFHNWTGNRVTLRDWCQLSLKEGLTVFRDQEFSGDMTDRGVQRIKDVDSLRERQFPEDAGPNAHAVRPESYLSVDNFFTTTIYEKGAELIRMMQTTVGRKGFRKGMDLYFERHDGQAVTTEDFAAAIADANGADFTQLRRWYSQAGTPRLHVSERWLASEGVLELNLRQSCPPTPGQSEKQPFQIPIRLGVLDDQGRELEPRSPDVRKNSDGLPLIDFTEMEKTIRFAGFRTRPHLSLLREFSAPVIVEWDRADNDLFFLMAKDTDGFNRREAAQEAARRVLSKMIAQAARGEDLRVDENFVQAWSAALQASEDPAYLACLLNLPSDVIVLQSESELQPAAFRKARRTLVRTLGNTCRNDLLKIYRRWHGIDSQKTDSKSAGHRAFKNLALFYLVESGDHEGLELAWAQSIDPANMTDRMDALTAIASSDHPKRIEALERFAADWKSDSLVMNKWLSVQAGADRDDTFENVRRLSTHPSYQESNPNNVYSLLRVFGSNLTAFHGAGAPAYAYYTDRILAIDRMNPQVAARLCANFNVIAKLPKDLKTAALGEIRRVVSDVKLSKNVRELMEPMVSEGR